jgi:hypothetical protein
LTIGNTALAASGAYTVTITGTDATISESTQVRLNVADAPPGSTTLIAPANGAGNVSYYPAFSWSSASQGQSYLLEVDDDPAFGSVDYTATATQTTHTAVTPFTFGATYYWRVTPQNECGSGVASESHSFTVQTYSLACNGPTVDFEHGLPPDWTVEDASFGGLGIDWATTADAACLKDNLTGGTGEAACADSDAAGIAAPAYDTRLTTPALDLSGATSASLDLRAYYDDLNIITDFFDIDVWNGTSWTTELHWDEDHSATALSLDLSSYLGISDVLVRFRYAGDGYDWYAEVDDISLLCTVYGVELSPDAQQSGAPGDDVAYSVQITNTGSSSDTFDLALGGNSWTTALSDSSVTLAAGTSTTVDVTVSIPSGANNGDNDVVTVTATSQANPSQSATVQLETTADVATSSYDVFLPAIFKP